MQEKPIVFDCEGAELIGMLHLPEQPLDVGVLTVAAGTLQYRAGCGRQLVSMARSLAVEGTPVMRFDHRGKGDSGGELLGFENIEADLMRAVEEFREHVPTLKHIVLYGGCEAASGIMISAWRFPEIKSLILANPWVTTETTRARASQRYYIDRLGDSQVWKKLFTLRFNLIDYGLRFLRFIVGRMRAMLPSRATGGAAVDGSDLPYQDQMLAGFQKFDGPVLFLKSGLSLISEEFDQLVASSAIWQKACSRSGVKRVVLPAADQTFSTVAARRDIIRAISDWVGTMGCDDQGR